MDDLIIVGVGASAGGLEAFTQLLTALPSDTGLAFVLVQHLAPRHESTLPALLAGATTMSVQQVRDGTRLKRDQVYVIPPNAQMELAGQRRLHLTPRPTGRAQHTPIDRFFRSMAASAGSRAIGIVLSGTASDGALGLREIKAAGGIAIAQDPDTAAYGGMPHAAVATGVVDLVLPVQDIAKFLQNLRAHPYVVASRSGGDAPVAVETVATEKQLQRIFSFLRAAMGVDFSLYKPPTIKRRILRRMSLHRLETIDTYTTFLAENPKEVEALYHDILIQVTHFFREPEALEALVKEVVPGLLKDRRRDSALRVWLPGCATGEEVYSMVILLLEALGKHAENIPIQVFGTDVSEAAVEFARNGVYTEAIAEHVSSERLRSFFTHGEGSYRISKRVRDQCIFARQDLTRDPPFSKLDMIVCRNVLIYLGASLQKRLMQVFHYALNPNGHLLLGKAETAGQGAELFSFVDKKQRIYRRRNQDLVHRALFAPDVLMNRPAVMGRKPTVHEPSPQNVLGMASQYLMDHYTPAGVVVDSSLQIIQFRGQTGPYLEPAPGSASLNLLKMTREGLLYGLRGALQAARKKGDQVSREGLRVRSNGGYRWVGIDVCPLRAPGQDTHYLIIFRATDAPALSTAGRKHRASKDSREQAREQTRVTRLQQELAASREYMQSMIQDLEAANEELQSANEEILSSNEELQSTNEELDTAKEELQSINEELNTVNEELHGRNEELNSVNSDLMNVLSGVQVALVMVNAELRIRRFTPLAEKLFNLIPGDIGRPIGNIHPTFDGPDLQVLIAEVVDSMTGREQEVRDREGHWYNLVARPYKSAVNRVDGAVLALYDIDAVRRHETRSRFYREVARTALELMGEPMLVIDSDLRVKRANRAWCRRFNILENEIAGRPLADIADTPWKDAPADGVLANLLQQPEGTVVRVMEGSFGPEKLTARVTARRIAGDDDRGALVLLLTTDGGTRDAAPQ
ncbi:MAG: chemotaxis protein CheB [Candidatus Polarisedimenticolia bacterium]